MNSTQLVDLRSEPPAVADLVKAVRSRTDSSMACVDLSQLTCFETNHGTLERALQRATELNLGTVRDGVFHLDPKVKPLAASPRTAEWLAIDAAAGIEMPTADPTHSKYVSVPGAASMSVAERVEKYLDSVSYPVGTAHYYARMTLEEALKAYRKGNYGIGAVLVARVDNALYEIPGANTMVTGPDWIHGHAESNALQALLRGEYATRREIEPGSLLDKIPSGLHMFGTLEPCPMCQCALINAAAYSSMSGAEDPVAAYAIGDRRERQPIVWSIIQKARGLECDQFPTIDSELLDLSASLFMQTREEIDSSLGRRDFTSVLRKLLHPAKN